MTAFTESVRRFLDLLAHFLVFEDDGSGKLAKKMASYHQFHAVRTAMAEALRASGQPRLAADAEAEPVGLYAAGRRAGAVTGDRRVGVVWHTQGSGKSLTMAFYAGRVIREPAMANPTVVVITDRNDLDDQLFGTFSRCQGLLRLAAAMMQGAPWTGDSPATGSPRNSRGVGARLLSRSTRPRPALKSLSCAAVRATRRSPRAASSAAPRALRAAGRAVHILHAEGRTPRPKLRELVGLLTARLQQAQRESAGRSALGV